MRKLSCLVALIAALAFAQPAKACHGVAFFSSYSTFSIQYAFVPTYIYQAPVQVYQAPPPCVQQQTYVAPAQSYSVQSYGVSSYSSAFLVRKRFVSSYSFSAVEVSKAPVRSRAKFVKAPAPRRSVQKTVVRSRTVVR